MIKYVSRDEGNAVVMTIIHIGEEEEGCGDANIGRNCKEENMVQAYMWCKTAVHVILILK